MTAAPDDPLLRDVTNVDNHRVLLHLALSETRGSAHPVLAMGVGLQLTRLLHDHCERAERRLVSMEDDIFAAARAREVASGSRRHEFIFAAWEVAPLESRSPWSVAVMNHAPGERRKDDVRRLADRADIIVLHDTEPNADVGYRFSEIWPLFRWRVDVKTDGAWATAVSNSRDLSGWRGFRSGPYVVTMGDEDVTADEVSVQIERMFEERSERM